jgi:hypothetical protein
VVSPGEKEFFFVSEKDTESRVKSHGGVQWESEKCHNPFESFWEMVWVLDVDVRAERVGCLRLREPGWLLSL